MNAGTIAAAILALAVPIAATAQDITLKKGYIGPAAVGEIMLSGPGVAGEHRVAVIAPRNFLEQGRRGTLRELELYLPQGPIADLLVSSYQSRSRIDALSARGGSAPYLQWEMKNVQVTSYQLSPADAGADKYARVKVQFAWEPHAERTAAAPGAQIAVADLTPVNGLQLGPKLIPWGQVATIPADQASSKQAGRCEFRYRYDTVNQGNAAAGPATNLVLLNAPNGAELAQDALPGLAVAAQHASSGTLWLAPGTWTIYVHVDGKQDVAEADEQNNLRRVRVQLEGSCD